MGLGEAKMELEVATEVEMGLTARGVELKAVVDN